MKKASLGALALSILLVASACSGQTVGTDSGAEASPQATAGAPAVTSAEAPAPEPTPAPAEPEMPDLGTIQVGYIPILGFAPFFVAVEKGYFAEQGLDVKLQSFRSGGPMIGPLSAGQLDVGGGEAGPALFNAIAQGLDVVVVGALAAQPPGFGAVPFLVRSDLFESGEITEPADLAGRKVAVNIERGTAEYLAAEVLAKAGLTVDDVELISIPFPEMPAALANAAVDAAILPHPLAGRALGEGSAVALFEGDEIVDTPQNGVLYFGRRLLEAENREVAVRFLAAYLKAARELQGDGWRSDENVAIINTYTNVPEPAIKGGVAYFFDPNGAINEASLETIQAYHVGRGYTELAEPLPLAQIVDGTFLGEALSRVGLYDG